MTVRCPRCGTLYRRPTRPGVGSDATFRCSRCRHVFGAEAEEPDLDLPEDDEPAGDERFAFDEERDDDEPRSQPVEEPDESDECDESDAPEPRGVTTAAHFAVRALLGVTLAYACVSVYLWTHPESTRTVLRHLPLIGARLSESRLNPASVQLANVHGDYRRVQGDHLVFVVSGTAINDSPVPVKGVQVQATLVGATKQRQVVFCGAAPRAVQELSLREIALLQTLEPPKDWTLAPGEQADFLVAFPGPPADLKEFTAEVVAVHAPARRIT